LALVFANIKIVGLQNVLDRVRNSVIFHMRVLRSRSLPLLRTGA